MAAFNRHKRRIFIFILLQCGLHVQAQHLSPDHEKSCMMAEHLNQAKISVVSIQSYTFNQGESWKRIGSGCFYYLPDYIITRQSVIQGADSIVVILSNGQSGPAYVVDCDPVSQIAVLKTVFKENYMAVPGNSDTLKPGDCISILGNSLGVFPSVTLGHYIRMDANGMMELDGNVAPGNSGSPVFSEDGRLAGIIAGRRVANSGQDDEETVGLALPVETINAVLQKMSTCFESKLGWVGMRVMDFPDTASGAGVEVMSVTPGGPAARANIAKGDTLVQFDGQPIESASQLKIQVHATKPEKTVVFGVKKDSKIIPRRVRVHSLRSL